MHDVLPSFSANLRKHCSDGVFVRIRIKEKWVGISRYVSKGENRFCCEGAAQGFERLTACHVPFKSPNLLYNGRWVNGEAMRKYDGSVDATRPSLTACTFLGTAAKKMQSREFMGYCRKV